MFKREFYLDLNLNLSDLCAWRMQIMVVVKKKLLLFVIVQNECHICVECHGLLDLLKDSSTAMVLVSGKP